MTCVEDSRAAGGGSRAFELAFSGRRRPAPRCAAGS